MKKFVRRKIYKSFLVIILILNFFVSSLAPFLNTPFSPKAAEAAGNVCAATGPAGTSYRARVGGVALDQAAQFLANMTDVTGAYYDSTLDRIVFVGKTNTSTPKFDKDDTAVAIKALFFKNEIPAVSMEFKDPNNMFGDPNLKVIYYGGIEDTKFGKVLVDADYKLKQYAQGYDQNQQRITSSVPGYKSHFDRFLEKGPDPSKPGYSRWWIEPQLITLKKDDSAKSFVFDTVKMQVRTEGLNPNNDPAWNAAATEFAQQQTDQYDQFANETPSYQQAKGLAKIVGVVKWIRDNQIANNFAWAKDYQPTYVATPREIPRLTTPDRQVGNTTWRMTGGVSYATPNTYNVDTGTSSSMKTAAQAVPTTKEDIHWTFSQNGQTYDAVAVSNQAFQSLGSYGTSETDVSVPLAGDLDMTYQRSYSSFSNSQYGNGRGWDMMPARLLDNRLGWYVNCTTGQTGNHPWKLAFQTLDGTVETFTYTSCSTGYSADNPAFHSKVSQNTDGTFKLVTKDQKEYSFSTSYKLTKIKDKNGNTLSYNYDGSGKLTSINDASSHTLTLSYNSQGLISQIADWAGRITKYGYDVQSNLVTVTDPRGSITRYNYNNNKLSSIVDRTGQTVLQNTYTTDDKIATQTDASGVKQTFTYDIPTKTISIVDNNNRTGKVFYDDKARVLQQNDALGYPVKFTYGNEFAPLTVTDKKNNKTTFTYDTNGNTTSITYPNTVKVSYSYDTKNNPTQITDGRYTDVNSGYSKQTTFTYDTIGNLTQKNESNLITKYTYNSNGEITGMTNPRNNAFAYTRDSFGNILTATDPLTNKTIYEYDSAGRLAKQTDPDGKIVSYSYDGNSNVSAFTDATGSTSYNYDPENRLTKTTLPNNSVTDYTYNPASTLSTVKDAAGSTTLYGYDTYRNLLSRQDALNQRTLNTYDQMNRQTQSTTPLGKATKWEYDANGNITKRTDAGNNAVQYTYDNLNRLTTITYPNLSKVTYTYNNRNNLTKTVDPAGTTTYTYDLYDRLTRVTNPYGSYVSYTYDNADNLTKVTYPDNRAVNYGYDSSNRLTSVSDWNNSQTTYSYNKNGLIATKNLPNGVVGNYNYDSSNRLIGLTYAQSSNTLAKFTYTRDAVGNITKSVEEGNFFTQITPTPTPTPSAVTPTPTSGATPTPTRKPTPTPTSGPTGTPTPTPVGGSADLIVTSATITPSSPRPYSFFRIDMTIKNQGTVSTGDKNLKNTFYYNRPTAPTYTDSYDDWDFQSINLAPGQQVTLSYPYLMNGAGSYNLWVLIDRDKNIVESNDNNNTFGPLNFTIAQSQSALQKLASQFSLPELSELFTVPKANAQTPPTQFTTNYAYDPLGRLTNATYPDSANISYGYDKVDNRTTQTVNTTATNYTYNADNQLIQIGTNALSYNANGDLTTRATGSGNQQYAYDFEDRLTTFTATNGMQSKYVYDGNGNRIQKTVGSTATRFVNDYSGNLSKVVAESNSSNSIQNWYLYGPELISQGNYILSNRLYPLSDGLGNVRFVTNYNGTQVKRYEYDPYGNVRSATGPNGTNYEFQSQQLDPESSMYSLRARYYDPTTGRFISKDPVKGYLTLPQTQNPYAYSLNNPINLTDPSGLDVYGACVNVNIGLAVYGTCSVCVVYSTKDKNLGAIGTLGGGGTTGATASVGLGGLYSNASSYYDLLGQDVFTGISGGVGLEGGGDVSWNVDDPSIKSYTPGVGLGVNFTPPFIPGEYHGGTTYTGGSIPIQLR